MEQTLQLINERDAGRLLSVSIAALRRWRREHRGPQHVHIERCVRYDIRAIEKFLIENSSSQKKAADSQSAAESGGAYEHATVRH